MDLCYVTIRPHIHRRRRAHGRRRRRQYKTAARGEKISQIKQQMAGNQGVKRARDEPDNETVNKSPKPLPKYHYCNACYHIRPVKLFANPNQNGDLGECAQCQRDLARNEFRDATLEKFYCQDCSTWMHPELSDNMPNHDAESDSDEEEGYEDDAYEERCGECSNCHQDFTIIAAKDTKSIIDRL